MTPPAGKGATGLGAESYYNKVTPEIIAALVNIAGGSNVLTGEERANYAHDEEIVTVTLAEAEP